MPRCKTCGTVYSALCDACPKCSCPSEGKNEEQGVQTTPKTTGWVWLVIGICGFIGFIYLVFLAIASMV